jgi:hypothetical protein
MKIIQTIMYAWICAFLIFYPTISYADDPIPIKAGEPAPFDGVILRTEDAATLLVTLEQQTARCEANINLAVSTALAAKQLELDTCNSNFQIRTDLYNTQLTGYQEYSAFLEGRITKPRLPPELVLVIGILTGVGITIGAGVAMNQAAGQ